MTISQRDSLFVEQAQVISQDAWPDQQYIMRIRAPECARRALPGQFIHLQCDPSLALRRPLSIMAVHPEQGWIDLLYKVVGHGTHLLSKRVVGDEVSIIGPIGKAFTLNDDKPVRLLIGGGVGIPPVLFLANTIAAIQPDKKIQTYVLMGSESPFPFKLSQSSIKIEGIDKATNQSLAAVESLGITSRLASLQHFPGCHQGYVTDLAEQVLKQFDGSTLKQAEIFACGPTPMLLAVQQLASDYQLDAQLSLEEYMACAVGGCAGCVVKLNTAQGETMKRVCVDGPVFQADQIVFQ